MNLNALVQDGPLTLSPLIEPVKSVTPADPTAVARMSAVISILSRNPESAHDSGRIQCAKCDGTVFYVKSPGWLRGFCKSCGWHLSV